jgi:hypothetical protein
VGIDAVAGIDDVVGIDAVAGIEDLFDNEEKVEGIFLVNSDVLVIMLSIIYIL